MNQRTTTVFDRAQIAWKNVQASARLRPADVINGVRLVHPLRILTGPGQSRDLVQLALEVFTRLHMQYRPHPDGANAHTTESPMQRRGGTGPRIGLFVDAPDHLSGVTMTLTDWHEEARRNGESLTVHTCTSGEAADGYVKFAPAGSFRMDAYDGLVVQIPRINDVLNYIQRMDVDAIHVSTPGPMGLLGLLAARMRNLPVCGTYHTDFPRYARALTGDDALEQVGWRLMHWFYGHMDRVAAPTESIRRDLIAHGFEASRLQVVGRGVDTTRFRPSHRDPAWREAHGHRHSIKLLYVGRLSREKNLETLAIAFRRLIQTRPDISLVLAGEGPFRNELAELLADTPAFFTGALHGNDLARAYASCDLFVFPSKTDTYGRVVLEAQASGLPVVVSDQGGPKDAMQHHQTGVVVHDMHAHNLAAAIDALSNDPARMARYREAASRYAANQTRANSFASFLNLHTVPSTIAATAKQEATP